MTNKYLEKIASWESQHMPPSYGSTFGHILGGSIIGTSIGGNIGKKLDKSRAKRGNYKINTKNPNHVKGQLVGSYAGSLAGALIGSKILGKGGIKIVSKKTYKQVKNFPQTLQRLKNRRNQKVSLHKARSDKKFQDFLGKVVENRKPR